MKPILGLAPLVVLVSLTWFVPLRAAEPADGDGVAGEVTPPSLAARSRQLAADVREFARAPGLSHAKREKRIATAVRVAIVAATAYRNGAEEVLGAAAELAAAASKAAPAYADVIAAAAAYTPAVARIEGATGQIRSATLAAARGGRVAPRSAREGPNLAEAPAVQRRHKAAVEVEPAQEARATVSEDVATNEPAAGRRAVARGNDAEPTDDSGKERERADRSHLRPDLESTVVFSATTDLSVRHDDNLFLAPTNKVGDTIVSAAPGIGVHWGANSLTHGSIDYQEAFERYSGQTVPNVTLGTGAGSFGYEDSGTVVALGANYQQLYQSNTDLVASGRSQLIRTNLLGANASFETELGAKTGVKVGGEFSDTKYQSGGLIGNRNIAIPLDLFYKITPKTDLSLGYTYGTQQPDAGGASSRDNYFNLGARGDFTAKLSGTFSLGYQTRKVAANPADRLFAFNGAFKYEITPKTGATLAFTRNFNASALGASTKNSVYRLDLNTELSPQWQLGLDIAYRDNDYGLGVFRVDPATVVAAQRTDRSWEGGLSATYLVYQWLTTSASYALRSNHSTLPGVDYSSNVVNVTVGLRY